MKRERGQNLFSRHEWNLRKSMKKLSASPVLYRRKHFINHHNNRNTVLVLTPGESTFTHITYKVCVSLIYMCYKSSSCWWWWYDVNWWNGKEVKTFFLAMNESAKKHHKTVRLSSTSKTQATYQPKTFGFFKWENIVAYSIDAGYQNHKNTSLQLCKYWLLKYKRSFNLCFSCHCGWLQILK